MTMRSLLWMWAGLALGCSGYADVPDASTGFDAEARGPAPTSDAPVIPADAAAPSTDSGFRPLDLASTAPDTAPAIPEVGPGVVDGAALVPDARPASVQALWAVGDGEAIERDASESPQTSLVWDGRRVRLFAARNEIVAFQIVVRASRTGIGALRASLPTLALRGGTSRIDYAPAAADPSDFRGRTIQIFAVNYMNVTRGSEASWIYAPGTPSAPADPTGWKPVQLVPENARPGRGGFPLVVAAGQNQALWFEIDTGRDRPAGLYEGSVSLTVDGATIAVPVELELFDFTLPDEATLLAMVYYDSAAVELYQGRNLDAAYHRFAHRQRIELVHAYSASSVQASLGRFRGDDFTSVQGYEGPGQGVGNRIIPASFYSPGSGWEDRSTAWRRSDAWMSFLELTVPGALTFLYMPDEPSPSAYAGIRTIASNIHSNPGPGRRLPIFVTRGYTAELDGAIDIWCSVPRRLDAALAARQRALGREWWTYNGGRPAGPAIVMDAPGTDARAIGWASFKAGMRAYFYWHAVHWRHNSQKITGDRNQNVWANPVTFDKRDDSGAGDFANGDGVLIYPGTELLHPEQDRGIAGPVSTMALANLRRGLQDHAYLTLARRRGLEPLVSRALQAIVPRVYAEAGTTVSFPETTDGYERIRLELARALADGAK